MESLPFWAQLLVVWGGSLAAVSLASWLAKESGR
jgi:hypothetical protein